MKTEIKNKWRRRGAYALFVAAALQMLYGLVLGFAASFVLLVPFTGMALAWLVCGLALHPEGPAKQVQLKVFGAAGLCLIGAVAAYFSPFAGEAVWPVLRLAGYFCFFFAVLSVLRSPSPDRLVGDYDRLFCTSAVIAFTCAGGWTLLMDMMRMNRD